MKYVCLVLISMFFNACFGQNSDLKGLELGLRFGSSINSGAALDVVYPYEDNRIHGNLGFFRSGFSLAGFYNWKKPLADGFDWYYGPGLVLGSNNYENRFKSARLYGGVGAEIGVEYPLHEVPLSLGLDFRPTLIFGGFNAFEFSFFGFNIRYRLE